MQVSRKKKKVERAECSGRKQKEGSESLSLQGPKEGWKRADEKGERRSFNWNKNEIRLDCAQSPFKSMQLHYEPWVFDLVIGVFFSPRSLFFSRGWEERGGEGPRKGQFTLFPLLPLPRLWWSLSPPPPLSLSALSFSSPPPHPSTLQFCAGHKSILNQKPTNQMQ